MIDDIVHGLFLRTASGFRFILRMQQVNRPNAVFVSWPSTQSHTLMQRDQTLHFSHVALQVFRNIGRRRYSRLLVAQPACRAQA